ncbi:MAG: PDZ domain-containing protein [Planctomycetaceae bacterium]
MLKFHSSLLMTLLICWIAFELPVFAWQPPTRELEEAEEQAFKRAVSQVAPSLVRIETVGGLDQVQNFLLGNGPTTGVVLSADGYVISSSFNFLSKPASILVTTTDGRRMTAKVIANDTVRSLTLLKVEADGLVPARAAAKESIKVGQWAIAVGRALDANAPNVSVGIVSAVNRVWGKAIQTDAKVSPVNYGGVLVDVDGTVLGVLVPLSPQDNSPVAGVEWYDSGIGFAIPLTDVLATLDRLKQGKDLRAGLAGFTFASTDLFGGDTKIDRVRYDSPIYRAGFKDGDQILEIDGHKVTRPAQVRHVLGSKMEGDKLAITIKRGEETKQADLTLVGELPPFEAGFLGVLPTREPRKGSDAADKKQESGVGVRWVYPESPAAKIGLKPRDRIVKFRDQAITSAAQLSDQVSRVRPTEKAAVIVRRDGQEQTLETTLVDYPADVPTELPTSPIEAVAVGDPKKVVEKPDGKVEVVGDKKPEGSEKPRTGRFGEEVAESKNAWWAFVPESYNPAYGYSLLVWLHPTGDTLEATIFDSWKFEAERRGIILLGLKAANIGAGWQANEAEFVHETVVSFQKKYSIDAGRIVLHGYDKSGPFATHLAFKHRDLFRGLMLAASLISERPPENLPEYRLQFQLICGTKDPAHGFLIRNVNALRSLKYPTNFTSLPDLEHRYPNADGVGAMARWIDSLDRL